MKGRAAHMLIEHIRRDGGTQIRGALDEGTVGDYAAAIKAKTKLPDVGVFFDGTDHWLWDGFHRIEAELRAGAKRVMADIKPGTQRDAILAACGANAAHGLRRSNADKRRAVETLLADAEWGEWSNRAIAKVTQVSDVFVGECRERLRVATTEQAQEVTSAEVQTFAPAVRQNGDLAGRAGDEGTGASVVADPSREAAKVSFAPVPNEPRRSPIDLLGLDDIDPAWLDLTDDILAALGVFDNCVRSAQASVSELLGRPGVGAQLQSLRQSAHELAARARKSVRPHTVCVYCKDPDGCAGRREACNGCRGLGYLTEEQLTAVPRELEARGEAAQVIDTKKGGFMARAPARVAATKTRKPKLRIEDAAGRELVVEREEEEDTEGPW